MTSVPENLEKGGGGGGGGGLGTLQGTMKVEEKMLCGIYIISTALSCKLGFNYLSHTIQLW